MGTNAGLIFWSESGNNRAIAEKVFAEFERFNRLYSSYQNSSELSYVNQQAAKQPIKLSTEFFDLIQRSLEFSVLSSGLFDITYAAVGQGYDYRRGTKPDAHQLQMKKGLINYRHIVLDPAQRTIFFAAPGTQIDLGGIGKGYVIERAVSVLKQAGISNGVIYAGGDSYYLGKKGNRDWAVGIRHPRDPKANALMMPISDAAVSTSGDYERYFIDQLTGKRHHHIIHPKTGESPRELMSATVISDDATTSDALSTSVMLAGVIDGLKLINTIDGAEAVLIDVHGSVFYSSGLADPSGITTASRR